MVLVCDGNDDWPVVVGWRRCDDNKGVVVFSDLNTALDLEGSTCDHLASIMAANRRISEFLGKAYLNGADWISRSRIEQEVEVNGIVDICKSFHVVLLSKLDVSNRRDLSLRDDNGLRRLGNVIMRLVSLC